jgi:hypothetical protein
VLRSEPLSFDGGGARCRFEVMMLRINGSAVLFTLALGLGASGCADNESSLFIEGVLNTTSSDCLAQPDSSAEFISLGVLDVAFAESYVAAVQVGNQITQQGNREKLRTETSRIHLEGATVTVFDVTGGVHPFEAIGTGFVHPASGTDPGLAAMFVTLVNPDSINAIAAAGEGQMVVRFRVFGTTLGGKEIESGDYDYPIFICNGCLIDFPVAANTAVAPNYECGGDPEDSEAVKVCYYGQDQRFPCTACSFEPICFNPRDNPWYN